MGILQRFTQKIFADNSSNVGQFGSGSAGTRVTSKDVGVLQSLDAYKNGWSSAVITNKQYPSWQEMDGLFYGLSYQMAYMFQNGIAEYDENTEYKNTSIVRAANTFQLYGSIQDNNIGNALTDTTYWQPLFNMATVFDQYHKIGDPIFTFNTNLNTTNEIWLAGQQLSKTGTYATLYSIYGDVYNLGDEEEGNFRVPNFTDRVVWGCDPNNYTQGYISAGLPNITGNFFGSDIHISSYADGAFRKNQVTTTFEGAGYSSSSNGGFSFKASRSSSIYGNSETVQPPAIKMLVKTRFI